MSALVPVGSEWEYRRISGRILRVTCVSINDHGECVQGIRAVVEKS